MKLISIGDFLSERQIAVVVEMWEHKVSSRQFHTDVVAKVIAPNLTEINRKLGQENDPNYLAYALEYVLTQAGGTP